MADLDLTQLPSSGFQPLTGVKFPNLASAVIQVLFVAAGVLFVIFLLVGGVQWVSSGGDKEGLDNARKKIKNALIGLIIVLGIYALGGVLNAVFSVDLFSVCFPGPDTPASFACPSSGIGQGSNSGNTSSGGPNGASGCTPGQSSPGPSGKTYTCLSGISSDKCNGYNWGYDFWCAVECINVLDPACVNY